jgi:hypothetical protein
VVVQENLLVDHDESSVQAVSFNYLRRVEGKSPRRAAVCGVAGCVLHAHRRNRQQHRATANNTNATDNNTNATDKNPNATDNNPNATANYTPPRTA